MASKRQRKKQQKKARQARQAAERQAKKERQAAERQKQYEKREQAKQAERQARQTAERKQAEQKRSERKKRKTSAHREWLINAFKMRVEEANAILREFDKEGTRRLLEDDYGGVFADEEIMTKSGYFRSNASKLSNAQLEQRISLLDSFIDDAPQYREDAKQAKKMAEQLGIDDPDKLQIFFDFMEFVRSVLGERLIPSKVIKDIAVARINRGDTLEEIKQAFMNAYLNSYDYWDMIDQFSERGVLI